MTRQDRLRAILHRLEARAFRVACVDGVPVDGAARRAVSKRYRVILTALMREVTQ